MTVLHDYGRFQPDTARRVPANNQKNYLTNHKVLCERIVTKNMRVITGSARGRVLETLSGNDVRPTSDRVKEAVFSIIQFELEGRSVLDLFGGSGQLGIEALSRGAEKATFVDSDDEAVKVIRKNLASTKLEKQAVVLRTDSVSFAASHTGRFDVVFLDPPYGKGFLQKVIPLIAPKVNTGGVIVCESPYDEKLPAEADDFRIFREYRYGKTKITVYRDTIL